MSGLLGLLLVSVSVSLSNFAGAIGIGLSGIDARTRLHVGIAILVLVGGYTIWQGRRVPKAQKGPVRIQTRRLLVTALALSIDNLAVGFALAVYQINIVLAAATMGVISVVLSLVGLELGSRLGTRVEQWSEELGGAVLILVGLALAIGVLG